MLWFFTVDQLYGAFFGVLYQFIDERPLFLRENANKTYRVLPYYLSKQIVDTPVSFLMPIIYAQIVYYGTGLTIDTERVLIFNLALVIHVWCASALGIFIGTIFKNDQTAIVFGPMLLLPMVLFSGFNVNLNTIYVWLRWIQWINPVRYTIEILVRNEFDGNDRYITTESLSSNTLGSSSSVAEQFGYTLGIYNCMIIVAALGLVLRILSFAALKFNATKVQA
jgi:ABC-type multidrug transport system permease subunit